MSTITTYPMIARFYGYGNPCKDDCEGEVGCSGNRVYGEGSLCADRDEGEVTLSKGWVRPGHPQLGPGPIRLGQGWARVNPGPMTKYILFIYLILYMAQTARLTPFWPILAISILHTVCPPHRILPFKKYIYYKILISI